MAKRFQDNEEWKSHFVRGLPGPYKAFWFYLKSACDHAGIWEIDIDEVKMRTGNYDISISEAEVHFSAKIFKLPCGEKWFLFNFCDEQYNTNCLDPFRNTAHRGVVKVLHKLKLIDNDFNVLKCQFEGFLKPLPSTFKGTKDKDLDKDLDNIESTKIKVPGEENLTDEDKTTSVPKQPKQPKKEQPTTFLTPLVQAFRDFKEMRVKMRKPMTERAVQMIHTELTKLAGNDEALKILILEQSTRKGWLDVFPLKTDFQQAPAGNQSKAQQIINQAAAAQYTGE